jgi:hypothetical protein
VAVVCAQPASKTAANARDAMNGAPIRLFVFGRMGEASGPLILRHG